MKNINLKAFTLVELIVVITIVSILSTVGFVSYSGYLTGARDSNRFSQLTKLSDSLQVYAATKSLPLPDDYKEVTASGIVLGYQGYVGVDVLETIEYTNGGKDPKDDSYFTYYLSKDRKSLQLLTLMEEASSIAQNQNLLTNISSYAVSYEERFPKVYGKKLGVITQNDTNIPLQEISSLTTLDIVNTNESFTAHISDEEKITGTGSALVNSMYNSSCKRIKQIGMSEGNGFYNINFAGAGEIKTYCYMENGEAIEDALEGAGDFRNGVGIPTESGSNPTNEIVQMLTPIDSGYALHQTGNTSSEYQFTPISYTTCLGGYKGSMELWFSGNHERVFHAQIGGMYYGGDPIVTEESRGKDGRVWKKIVAEFTSNSFGGPFIWYLGWVPSNVYPTGENDDIYVTGVRMSCHP